MLHIVVYSCVRSLDCYRQTISKRYLQDCGTVKQYAQSFIEQSDSTRSLCLSSFEIEIAAAATHADAI